MAVYAPTSTTNVSTVKAGGTQSVSAKGFAPRESVQVTLHSTPTVVATVTSDALGSVQASYRVPTTLAAGAHQVVLTGRSSGLTVSHSFTVTAAAGSGSGSGSG